VCVPAAVCALVTHQPESGDCKTSPSLAGPGRDQRSPGPEPDRDSEEEAAARRASSPPPPGPGRGPGAGRGTRARPPAARPGPRTRVSAGSGIYFRRISRLMAAMTSEVEACELCEEVVGRERHRCQQCGLLCAVCAGAHSKMKVLLKCRRRRADRCEASLLLLTPRMLAPGDCRYFASIFLSPRLMTTPVLPRPKLSRIQSLQRHPRPQQGRRTGMALLPGSPCRQLQQS